MKTTTKKELIEMTAKNSEYSLEKVKEVLDTMEIVMRQLLEEFASENTATEVEVFCGVYISAEVENDNFIKLSTRTNKKFEDSINFKMGVQKYAKNSK